MKYLSLLLALLFFSCRPDIVIEEPITDTYYFPSSTSSIWETVSPDSLDWNAEVLLELYEFMEENSTRGFMILQDGKIAVEEYWGKKITSIGDFDENSYWYWASAGKTMTAAAVGVAQQKGALTIDDKTSDYLGKAWTSMAEEKEDLIKIRHQLTMTTGLDYTIDFSCTDPSCLQYNVDAGDQWYYHNGPYTLLQSVVANATGKGFSDFVEHEILEKIGANGMWVGAGANNIFYSTVRDAARFGSLIINDGKWNGVSILQDSVFFSQMINSSQELNPAYGFLWWLNGKSQIQMPGSEAVFSDSLAPDAPEDLIAAMGANGQFIDIIPSKKMVVIRFGQQAEGDELSAEFHREMLSFIQNL